MGETCLYTDLGNLALDVPGRGTCKKIKNLSQLPVCAQAICSSKKASYVCVEVDSRRVTTCGVVFKGRSSGGDGEGVKCRDSTRGFPGVDCGDGERCVYNVLGNPPVDIPGSGVCQPVEGVVEDCSVGLCARIGGKGLCLLKGDGRATTCEVFAKDQNLKTCEFACTLLCEVDGPCDQNGKRFCSLCQLQGEACRNGFKTTVGVCPPESSGPPIPSPGGPASPIPLPEPEPVPSESAELTVTVSPDVAPPGPLLGGQVGDSCCDDTCGIADNMPCMDGLVCVLSPVGASPGAVVDAEFGKCEKPKVAMTPRPTPVMKGKVGDSCCDVTCGIAGDMPCLDGLVCVLPPTGAPPGVVVDAEFGKCEKPKVTPTY